MNHDRAEGGQMTFDYAPPLTGKLTHRQMLLLSVDRLYDIAGQETLKILKEDKRVERKPISVMKAHELADYFSMWANTGPEGGLIAVGIANDGTAVGCLSTEIEYLNRLETEAYNQCPDARPQCKRIEVRRDKDGERDIVLLFRVRFNPNKVVFTVRNEAFIRLGESKHRLSYEEIRDLQNEKGEISIESELCPQYTFPGDFDAELVNDFCTNVSKDLSRPLSPEELMANRHLGTFKEGRFVPNAACVLMFANNPRLAFGGAKIQLLRFQGEDERVGKELNAVKNMWAEGPIPRLLQVAEEFLTSQLRDFSGLGNDGRFWKTPEYPRDVWYEAVVNALVHRSYGAQKNMTVKIKMFDDHLVVESPGGFPAGITPENIYDALSHPRNQFVMDAMWFLRFVKAMAEGTRRMRHLMSEHALPAPEFVQKEVGYSVVRVVLRNNIKQRQALIDSALAASLISPEVYQSLTDTERTILNHVAENETINTTQAMRVTGKGWKSVHKILLKLSGRGILHHHHNDKDKDPFAHFTIAARHVSTDKRVIT
jgi:ATP-dependent DNA helicase RecG